MGRWREGHALSWPARSGRDRSAALQVTRHLSPVTRHPFSAVGGTGPWPCRRKPRRPPPRVSLSVGWGWIESARSRTAAPISMASTASVIRSPAPAPTMPQPRTRSVSGSISHLVSPSVRPRASARPLAAQGNWATSTRPALPLGLALGQAGPGDFRIGEDHGGNRPGLERAGCAGQGLDGRLALVRGLVGQHRLAGHVADGQDVRVGGAPLVVDHDEALARRARPWCSPAPGRRCWACGPPRPARG